MDPAAIDAICATGRVNEGLWPAAMDAREGRQRSTRPPTTTAVILEGALMVTPDNYVL
jgi:hypothetical protein